MSDIEKFIAARKALNPKAWADFDAIEMLLALHRQRFGLSLTEFVKRTKMKIAALSRLENYGEDVRLSTITRYVQATGRPFALTFTPVPARGTKTRRGQHSWRTATTELVSA
jgi:transcriptional regulator with XRE-family HTH domain